MDDDNHDRSAIEGGGSSRPGKMVPGGFSLLLLLFYTMGVGMVACIARVLGQAMQSVGVR
jgi:hypothetical protein